MYANGLGVPREQGVARDDVEALMWLLLAPLQSKDPAISMPASGAPDIAAEAKKRWVTPLDADTDLISWCRPVTDRAVVRPGTGGL